jgi:hypothetical protein
VAAQVHLPLLGHTQYPVLEAPDESRYPVLPAHTTHAETEQASEALGGVVGQEASSEVGIL